MNAMTNFESRSPTVDATHATANAAGSHLTEDQIDDQLLGDLGAAAAAHLAGCKHCAARVASAAEPIADFREMSMAWSERRSATMPLPMVERDGLIWQRRMGWATTAFALALGISLLGNGHKGGVETASLQPEQTLEAPVAPSRAVAQVAAAPRVVAVAAVQDTPAERYSGDNRMLQAIDSELDASVESPATMGLDSSNDQPSNESGRTSLED